MRDDRVRKADPFVQSVSTHKPLRRAGESLPHGIAICDFFFDGRHPSCTACRVSPRIFAAIGSPCEDYLLDCGN